MRPSTHPIKTLKTLAASAAFAVLALTAGTASADSPLDGQPAPEFTGINHWLNSQPLTLKQLRGKVVLVDFWTYTCINCIHTLPYVTQWDRKYRDKGLVVVGVHTPEFPFERDTDNVKTALKRHNIQYPVAQDNQFATWNAYKNQFWPAFYLIDRQGKVVETSYGEGHYDQTEAAIQRLLAEKP